MRCVVFGGQGFIGSHLAEQLYGFGHQVTVFDRRRNPLVPPNPNAQFLQGDFADRDAVEQALTGSDVVFHLIGTTVPQTSNANLLFDLSSNALTSIQLLEACVGAGVERVVFLSSGGTVYGIPQELPIPETHATNPICSYGLTKLVIEKYLALFHHLHGLDYRVLRCSNAYGPRQNPNGSQGAVAVFMGRLARGESIRVWGDGQIVRDYVYVQDIARALVMAALTSAQERVLNIGSGVGVSINQLLETLRRVTGQSAIVEYAASRRFDVPANVLDISLAQQKLGWTPAFDLQSGLLETWEWVQGWVRRRVTDQTAPG